MLYNKKWDSQAKPVEPSLKGIIAWLETKDPNEEFTYESSTTCAMAQYLQAIGQFVLNQGLGFYGISRALNTRFDLGKFPFHNTESKNFGELLNHLKRLDSQPS